ncbi:MAG: threonine/serine exporter family protein [Lachnospiraceae bacterium]|nr:threonine/serine exporter family protein [Lachnospiraceae bacterium]
MNNFNDEKINEYISSNREADILVRQLLNIGEAMYKAGGEISRIEDSIYRLGKKYGALHFSVYALTSILFVTAEFPGDYSISQSRRITERESTNLYRLEELNQLCRECAINPLPVMVLQKRVLEILGKPANPVRFYLGELIATFGLTFFFGGNVLDAIIATLAVLVICFMQKYIKPLCSGLIFFNILTSFVSGSIVCFFNLFIPGLHVNHMLIGVIMVLIPGVAITNSMRYILSGDTISSLEKLVDSLLQAFAIAAGFILAMYCFKTPVSVSVVPSNLFRNIVQVLTAMVGTLGYCMVFNSRPRTMIITMFGGGLCWATYLLTRYLGCDVFVAAFMATLVIGIYGEISAHLVKVPTTVFFIPACIPLIPGRNLYYSALGILARDWRILSENLILLSLTAVGISFGFALVIECDQFINKLKRKRNNQQTINNQKDLF